MSTSTAAEFEMLFDLEADPGETNNLVESGRQRNSRDPGRKTAERSDALNELREIYKKELPQGPVKRLSVVLPVGAALCRDTYLPSSRDKPLLHSRYFANEMSASPFPPPHSPLTTFL